MEVEYKSSREALMPSDAQLTKQHEKSARDSPRKMNTCRISYVYLTFEAPAYPSSNALIGTR